MNEDSNVQSKMWLINIKTYRQPDFSSNLENAKHGSHLYPSKGYIQLSNMGQIRPCEIGQNLIRQAHQPNWKLRPPKGDRQAIID